MDYEFHPKKGMCVVVFSRYRTWRGVRHYKSNGGVYKLMIPVGKYRP
jgi:SH3-like domain-containing protein